jgi:hypothetical protein
MLSCLVDALRYVLPAVSFIGLVVAGIAYVTNQPYRDRVNAPLEPAQLEIPERMMCGYDASKLQRVIETLRSAPAVDGRTPLDLYVRPVLYWNDIVFAVALTVFSATLWLWVLLQFEPSGLARWFVIIFMIGAVMYGVTDVAEDLMLARLFTRQTVSDGEARVASALTQIKIVANGVSITAAVVFFALGWLTPHEAPDRVNSPAPS